MDRLTSGVHQCGNRQLQLPDQRVLLLQRKAVRLYQCIAEAGDIFIFDAVPIERVKPDPCTRFRIAITHCRANISVLS